MRTRSSSNLVGESSPNPTTLNLKHRNRRCLKQPFILEESPVDTMADQRTMAELLRAPSEGYAEAIMVLPILAEQLKLKHSLVYMMTSDQFFRLEKDNPRDHIRWFNKITFTIKPLPSNTIANLKGELKAITTRSGLVLYGPFIPMPPPFINPEEDERVKETLIDQDLAEFTIKVPPPLVQKAKPLVSNKEKLLELANTPVNENCSAIILKKLPKKLGDPMKFLILCSFSELKCKALADLGASINLMPLSVWKKLDSILEVANPNNNLFDTILEMFYDEHALDYSFPPLYDDYDDDIFKLESSDFLPSPEYDSFRFEDFFDVDALPSTNNEDLFEVSVQVTPDKNVKKIAISHAFLYELPFNKEVPWSKTLLSFSSKNKEIVFKPEILPSKGVYTSLLLDLSHRGPKAFKVTKILESPMEIFPCSYGEDIRILDVPCLHFYPL
nr:reverse transcriptase domain-containing protein [Tanacetum cinerariifolium]